MKSLPLLLCPYKNDFGKYGHILVIYNVVLDTYLSKLCE